LQGQEVATSVNLAKLSKYAPLALSTSPTISRTN
jgi:hypothetical protein